MSKIVRGDAKGRVINREVKQGDTASDTERKKKEKEKRRYNRVIFSASANARVGTGETFFVSGCVSSLCPGEENIQSTEETITRAFSPTVFY